MYESLITSLAKQLDPDADESQADDLTENARFIESKGWRVWLNTLFPFAVEEDFSADHEKFWELRWSVLLRIREQKKYARLNLPLPKEFQINDNEYATLLILGRGLAKSSTIEMSAVMRGALLGRGYCLYVCEAQDQAEEHVGNCKGLINHPESQLTIYYPKMEVVEGATVEGIKTKDRTDLFVTQNGWICRAKGLNSKLRGLRMGNKRPDDLKADDIDGVNDSIAVSQKKLKQLTSSVIPTQARRYVTIDFGQNLILETGVMHQIYTGKSDALAARTTIGVTNTFVNFDYETYFDEKENRTRHRILPSSVPTWAGVDIAQAQKFLNDSGLDTFNAEYQNEFGHLKQGKVIHAYNEARHIITWSMFEKVFGCRYIPVHWQCEVGADIGYTVNSISAWTFRATSAQNSIIPGKKFIYRGRTFERKSIDDQAIDIWKELFPDDVIGKRHFEATTDFGAYPELLRLLRLDPKLSPYLVGYKQNPIESRYDFDNYSYEQIAKLLLQSQIKALVLSHEKSGELKTLAQKYGLPLQKTDKFGADDGVAEWNNLLRGDFTLPHPFKEDERLPDGTYKLGSPDLLYIVDDNQYKTPVDDRGLKTHRESVAAWEYTKEKLLERGMTEAKPMKYKSDTCDSERMLHARSWGIVTSSTTDEKIDEMIRKRHPLYTQEAIMQRGGNIAGALAVREKLEKKYEEQLTSGEKQDSSLVDWLDKRGAFD